ncbi:porin [Thalassovita sp.]|uniref:porin n=1 Tax=Thalassovita sp. TaxID=1979401 RepID=UPI003B5AFA5C
MKKILLASTALIAGASAAAADITLSGYGRFGLIYNDTAAQETIVDQRLRLIVTGTAESQNGIAFKAQTRLQWDDGAVAVGDAVGNNTGAIRAAAFHASAGGLTLSIGNVSAAEATPGFYAGGLGYTGFMFVDPWSVGYFGHDIGLTSDADNRGVVMATYKTGAFTVRASVSEGASERKNLGVVYADNGYVVSLSHQESDNNAEDVTKLYVQGALGGATVGLFLDDTAAGNGWGLTGTMSVGAATKVTVTVTESAGGAENAGIGINHDLGGGVSFGAGVADMNGATYAEAGVVFNF